MLHFSPLEVIAILLTCLAGLLFAVPNFFSKETRGRAGRAACRRSSSTSASTSAAARTCCCRWRPTDVRKDWLDDPAR